MLETIFAIVISGIVLNDLAGGAIEPTKPLSDKTKEKQEIMTFLEPKLTKGLFGGTYGKVKARVDEYYRIKPENIRIRHVFNLCLFIVDIIDDDQWLIDRAKEHDKPINKAQANEPTMPDVPNFNSPDFQAGYSMGFQQAMIQNQAPKMIQGG